MIEIIPTKDGSHTLKNTELKETYHSIHGALQESLHVFMQHGLEFKIAQSVEAISVLEVGFGTGLNAWLTAKRVAGKSVSYTSLESYPLDETIWSQLNYATNSVDQNLFEKIHTAVWNQMVSITPDFQLHKINQTIQQVVLPGSQFDLVYFDAFAPDKQPEMWQPAIFNKVMQAMKPGAVLVTYCAKGQVKRDLKSVGLRVEALTGPPGKREMIRATKL